MTPPTDLDGMEKWQTVVNAAKAHGHKRVVVTAEFLDRLLGRVRELSNLLQDYPGCPCNEERDQLRADNERLKELFEAAQGAVAMADIQRDQLRTRVETLEKSAVPPYVSCEMCGSSGCCDGEWFCGSEVRCWGCGETGEITSHDHESGHTYWVLSSLDTEETQS